MEGHAKNRPLNGLATESRWLHLGPGRPEIGTSTFHKTWTRPQTALADAASCDGQPDWQPRQYRWVVEIAGQVIGEVELIHDSQQTARLRHLRIDPAWQRTAALSRLIECVHQYCSDHGRLLLHLEPGAAPRWVLHMLRRRGVQIFGRDQADERKAWRPLPVLDGHFTAQHAPH